VGHEYDHTWLWFLLRASKKITVKLKSIILAVILLLMCSTYAQNSVFQIIGKVMDADTKIPLKNVGITINETLSGTVSDSTGAFHLRASGKTVVLNFLMLGYDKKSIRVNEGLKNTLTVELTQKVNALNEVTVNASPVEIVSKSRRYNVLDYDFYNDDILMITYVDLKKAKLVLINRNSDTLGYKTIPYEPNRLFKDCIGNLHVVCRDSIYQAHYNGKKLQLLTAKSVGDFERILLPCIAQDSLNFFLIQKYGSELIEDRNFHSYYSNNLGLNYSYINKKNRKKQLLTNIEDERMMIMSKDEEAFEERKGASGLTITGDRVFAETIIFKEIFAPLYAINRSIYIFDYVNSKIKRYNKEQLPDLEVPISFHKNLQFTREMQVDQKTAKAFAVFESNGISELKEISLKTGLVNASYKIPFVFVNHIKVYDNYIYFIRKGKEYDDTRYLSRLKID